MAHVNLMFENYHFDNSDSEDEMMDNVAARGRGVKRIRPRPDHFELWNDEEFFVRFRLMKPTVLHLLRQIEEMLESPTDRNGSVSPMCQLLLTLRFYALGTMLIAVGDFAGVTKATACKIVQRVSRAIASLRPIYVRMPQTQQEIECTQQGFYQCARFPRVVGCINCTHVKLQSPGGDEAENYRNRKGYFSYNVQTVCDHQLRITDIVASWPGAAHDQTIFNSSKLCARLEMGQMRNGLILGDSGYGLKPFLITPLRIPRNAEEKLFNESQIRTRSTVERSYGVWKRRFPILAVGMRVALKNAQAIIVACAVLHNMAINSKEPEPPQDPDMPIVDIEEGQIRDAPIQGHGNDTVRAGLIHNYFRALIE